MAFAAALAGTLSSSSFLSAGSAPRSSAAARAAQPASVTWVQLRLSTLSFVSPAVGGSAPAGGRGATRAVMPSSPNGLPARMSCSSAGSRRNAGARATSPASPMAVALARPSLFSRGRAPRPRAAARAEAPASPTCKPFIANMVTAGSAPAPSPSASRCTPLGPAEDSRRPSLSSAGNTEPSVPSSTMSASERPARIQTTFFASRSSLQLRSPALRHNAAAAS
eukprot:scaffold31281_cov57-Phaeocystis_antarctica.AAC.2